jgi:predicted TIM-barrel fold metal-dependent hydrolase
MPDLPLFDSLTHPTPDGSWYSAATRGNTVRHLEAAMAAYNVRWALAVGMKGIGGYRVETYADHLRAAKKKLFPIAYFDFQPTDSIAAIRRQLDAITRHGYVGIKLHPRHSRIDLRSRKLPAVFAEAARRGLVVLLCTYLYVGDCATGTVWDVGDLLRRVPEDCKVVLVHGGDVHLLGMMEMSRSRPNVLLDLSFTLCRFEGSSVDLDIRYLFRTYDRRLCVGSDSPQFSLGDLRRRFNELSAGLPREKAANIAHRNLLAFLGAT